MEKSFAERMVEQIEAQLATVPADKRASVEALLAMYREQVKQEQSETNFLGGWGSVRKNPQ